MPQVLGGLDAHVHQDLVERHVPAFLGPPRHFPRGVQRERFDGCVAVLGREPVQLDDALAAFARRNPEVRVSLGAFIEPRQLPAARPAEHLAEVPELHACHMLDQSQEVGAGGGHGPAGVVFAESVEFGEELAAAGTQVPEQNRFVIHAGHYTVAHLLGSVQHMAKLIYSGIMSLDGYTADAKGNFDWSMPDEEVHGFVNELERPIGTYLFGRRMYQVMSVWEDMSLEGEPQVMRDYAELWKSADKIVYSTTLQGATTSRTRIEREFDANAVRALKEAAPRDMSIGGPVLAAHAIKAGLVDEFQLFLTPVVVGGGLRYLPDDVGLSLELLEERRFRNGVVYLRYAKRQ